MSAPRERAVLLDGNVLVALACPTHVHHAAAECWFAANTWPFATCPITQGTLIRLLLQLRAVPDAATAVAILGLLAKHPRHQFWPDTLDYLSVAWQGVLGHRQVTDAYLASLARHHRGRLATFDQGLAALHPDVAELIAPA